MQKAIENTKLLLGEASLFRIQRWFEWAQEIERSNRVFKRITTAKDKEQLEDALIEIQYALIFSGLGFSVEFEPMGDRGPDLGISRDGHNVVVEIRRFRKVTDGPPVLSFDDFDDENFVLPEYGNIPRDVRKAFEKIRDKFRQIGNQKGIIAIWNDDEDLDEIEVMEAVYNIRKDVSRGVLEAPDELLFVLYGSKWIGAGKRQLLCFPFQDLDDPVARWKTEIEQETACKHIEAALSKKTTSS